AGRRWRTAPRLRAYLDALERTERPPRELEALPGAVRRRERVMLGLRLDEPLPLAGLEHAVDRAALTRLERLRLAHVIRSGDGPEELLLTPRGRMPGGGVTAEPLACSAAAQS